MKLNLLLFLFLVLAFCSCRRSADVEPNKDREALYQRFHGKYEIISSVADEALDLNLDGRSSVNLKDELMDFKYSNLELRIRNVSNDFLFSEFWQEACFGIPPGGGVPVDVNYCNQGVGRTFEFAPDLKSIKLLPDEPITDTLTYTRPASVLIKDGDLIEITKTKRFYTLSGWKYMRVVTLYKRYTITT